MFGCLVQETAAGKSEAKPRGDPMLGVEHPVPPPEPPTPMAEVCTGMRRESVLELQGLVERVPEVIAASLSESTTPTCAAMVMGATDAGTATTGGAVAHAGDALGGADATKGTTRRGATGAEFTNSDEGAMGANGTTGAASANGAVVAQGAVGAQVTTVKQ